MSLKIPKIIHLEWNLAHYIRLWGGSTSSTSVASGSRVETVAGSDAE